MDDERLAASVRVGKALQVRGLMLVTAESCTGGGIAETITAAAGSSAWFDRGFVTYSNAAKQQVLGVSGCTLAEHGAVSEQTVREMAKGALERSNAGLAVAVSGVAGPAGGSEAKPVGTVWLAYALTGHEVVARCHLFSGGRAEVRRSAVVAALEGIIACLSATGPERND